MSQGRQGSDGGSDDDTRFCGGGVLEVAIMEVWIFSLFAIMSIMACMMHVEHEAFDCNGFCLLVSVTMMSSLPRFCG